MSGLELIARERERQVVQEGWTPKHDDTHDAHELALAAVCYAAPDRVYVGRINNRRADVEDAWPWNAEDFKGDGDVRCWHPAPLANVLREREAVRVGRIRELTKAGALIAAEIDRLLRLSSAGEPG